jgi:hypothetical protein
LVHKTKMKRHENSLDHNASNTDFARRRAAK